VVENAAAIRAMICERAAWLGLSLDRQANAAGGPRIVAEISAVSAWAAPTNDELMIACARRPAPPDDFARLRE
jgi:acetate kinase